MRILSLLLLAGLAQAAPRASILAAEEGKRPRRKHLDLKRGQVGTLHAVLRVGRKTYSEAPKLKRARPFPEGTRIEWYRVEPRQHHVETPAPNGMNPAYSNNVLFGKGHGKWLGYDTLEYTETHLASGPTLRLSKVSPTDPRLQVNAGLGTMRYKVVVTTPKGSYASPGAEAVARGGISHRVQRVSFRRGNDLAGWLTSYYNVPNVFGSAGVGRRHQTDRHQGADCADVIVGALRKRGKRIPYTSVSGLAARSRVVTGRLLIRPDGLYAPDKEGSLKRETLRFGDKVREGDLLLIKYGTDWTGRVWDHIAVLSGDDGDGELGPNDPGMHMGYLAGLVEEPLARHGAATVQIVRLR